MFVARYRHVRYGREKMPLFTIDILEILEIGRGKFINIMTFQQTVDEFKAKTVE